MNTPREKRLIEIDETIEAMYSEYGDELYMPEYVSKELNELRKEYELLIEAETNGFGNVE